MIANMIDGGKKCNRPISIDKHLVTRLGAGRRGGGMKEKKCIIHC